MRFRWLILAPIVFSLVFPTSIRNVSAAPVFSDDLTTINHSIWSIVTTGNGPTVFSDNRGLQISLPSTSTNNPATGIFGAGLTSSCKLLGDFDIQVNYNLTTWPFSNGVRVGLSSDPNYIFGSDFAALPPFAVERTSLGTNDFPGPPREIYITDFSDRASLITLVGTSDLSGGLRLVRAGATETGYYYSGGWVPVHSGPTTTVDAPVSLVAWSHGYAFSGQDVSLALSNFVINQGQFDCPPLSDQFDNNLLNSTTWSIANAGTGPSTALTNNRVEISLPTTSLDDPSAHIFGSGLTSNCQLHGDFDIQVDYSLLNWPYANGVRVGLASDPAYIFGSNFSVQSPFAMERTSFGTSQDFTFAPREVYITDLGDRASYSTLVPTGDQSGVLRLVRSGGIETGYYFAPQFGWIQLHIGPAPTLDLPFSIVAWSHNYAFTQQFVKLAFDNFMVNSGQLVCPLRSNLSVTSFFTNSQLAPLPVDSRHFTSVTALFTNGVFRQTLPPRILQWVNVTNLGSTSFQSLQVAASLSSLWTPLPLSAAATKAFLEASNGTRIVLGHGASISVKAVDAQVTLTISNMTDTQALAPFSHGESLLLAIPIQFQGAGTDPSSYPLATMGTSTATAWTGASYTGSDSTGSATATLTEYSRALGDLSGDNRVDIVDVGMVSYGFGSKAGDSRWLPNADFDGDGAITIIDVSIVYASYGASM